jgi:hypothetical protein
MHATQPWLDADTLHAVCISVDVQFAEKRPTAKVTIHPGFPGTVPIFEGLSRQNYDVARDAHLSRLLCCVPLLSRVRSSFTLRVP